MKKLKQCPNGHYYQGDHCPYCKQDKNIRINNDGTDTDTTQNK